MRVSKKLCQGLHEVSIYLEGNLSLPLQLFQNVSGFRKAVFGKLGKYFLRVDEHFKTPVGKRLQLKSRNLLFELHQYFLRQTDGMGFVVSLRTIFDQYIHS